MSPIQLTAGDARRAASIIAHFGRGDQDGVAAILDEAIRIKRHGDLLLAVLHFYSDLIPELRTETGMQLLSSHVLKMATMEDDDSGEQTTDDGDEQQQ